ncbi:hypothetical protein SAMN05443549_10299 [Flavobacterium fluvii]|uniref:Lipoprotein n=1 Tax=Flavobacterium fluvii TaxID=468056 RepID=A0A1M5H6G1_9FLAO|nr:hypothetical protein [Flavobacterium fluvii]SHG11580.1 hypothetical protein SAMN05443549_10299 [Flavobacterium fluvii]
MKNIIILSICATLIGCAPVYYVPNTQNVPVIKEKGQTNLTLGLNASESTDGFEFQGAYGLTDKIALQLNADRVKSSEGSSNGSGYFVEFGPGYYKKLSEHVVFETYGLLAFGGLKYEEDGTNINANFFRIGAQPSISFTSKYFIASLSGRLANLNYNSVNGNYYDVEYLKANNSYWLIEPALTLQAGLENVKLFIQLQLSENLTDSYFLQDETLVSIGLKVNIDP